MGSESPSGCARADTKMENRVFACDAIAFQPEVVVSSGQIAGIDISHLESQAGPMSL